MPAIEEIEDLRAVLDEMRRTSEPARYVELNGIFTGRSTTWQGSHASRPIRAALRQTALNYIFLTVAQPDPGYAATVQAQHEEIFEAIRACQSERAGRAAKVHLRTTAKHVTALVNHELPHSPGYGRSVHSDSDQQTQR
jgi:DNA-binding GntR family transcriptional regulator